MDFSDESDSGGSSFHFPNFDIVTEFDDHHYIKSSNSKIYSQGSVFATIMKEWVLLQNHLPESIYVRVYESRIDLLRAAVMGHAGTPYHDGLFFFDILLPGDYPHSPPKVHYHSYGYELNPSLYACGKLCLSLINTSQGTRSEKWTEESTILQVLISIQELVLNSRPYFNKLGYINRLNSTSKYVMSKSVAYNEKAFVRSCKTMIQIIHKPPQHFEEFVVQHFCSRSASILAAVKDYARGAALVGQFESFSGFSAVPGIKVRRKFKKGLVEVEDELEKAFARLISYPTLKAAGFWKILLQCCSNN